MIAFLVFSFTILTVAFLTLQVALPLLFNRPLFSWFRRETRLDKVREQYRIAVQDAETEDAEQDLHEFLDDRIEQINSNDTLEGT